MAGLINLKNITVPTAFRFVSSEFGYFLFSTCFKQIHIEFNWDGNWLAEHSIDDSISSVSFNKFLWFIFKSLSNSNLVESISYDNDPSECDKADEDVEVEDEVDDDDDDDADWVELKKCFLLVSELWLSGLLVWAFGLWGSPCGWLL